MRIVVFGLAVSSAWGNGHATLWRGLIAALARRGHSVVFFEKDQPYYAAHRDVTRLDGGGELVLYPQWRDVATAARSRLEEADVAIVTSFCPDGAAACEAVLDARTPAKVYYDLDTPVTLARLAAGETPGWLPAQGLDGFDLALSFTGGAALTALTAQLHVPRAAPLYGAVDPDVHRPAAPRADFEGELSHLGTYSDDRRAALFALFLEPARRSPGARFVLGGPLYPTDLALPPNVTHVPHVAPAEHAAFYCSTPLTLNVTRAPMAALGWCPSSRLFEAAACGVPVLSDRWPGIEDFFTPGSEILLASTSEEALAALSQPRAQLARVGRAARERTLAEHTVDRRAAELEALLAGARGTVSEDRAR